MKSKTLHLMIGLPGTGKSTLIRNDSKFLLEGSVVVSSDDVIEDIANRYGYTYNDIFKDVVGFASKVFDKNLKTYLQMGLDNIIVDRTNLSASSRKKIIDLAHAYQYEVDAYVLSVPDQEEWTRRLNRPGKTIPQEVLTSMLASYQEPTVNEGLRNVYFY